MSLAASFLALAVAASVQTHAPTNGEAVLEIRSCNLKPGTRDAFHQLFREALPMLQRWKVDASRPVAKAERLTGISAREFDGETR